MSDGGCLIPSRTQRSFMVFYPVTAEDDAIGHTSRLPLTAQMQHPATFLSAQGQVVSTTCSFHTDNHLSELCTKQQRRPRIATVTSSSSPSSSPLSSFSSQLDLALACTVSSRVLQSRTRQFRPPCCAASSN
ncbi:hypothetical protein RRG08_036028 [Elysia crispata]|uniref:Uncharacterized protein n=1 Tax=Elysia crispata TaxID=231223 RepID=A0AAE1E149_9GAST|nr:hypothetical protein RRG08_036028 [Elysia crispata]